MIVDFPLVLQHQVQTILTMQRQRRFLRASSLFAEDLPEMGQRQDQPRKSRRLSLRHKDRSQKIIQKILIFVPRVVQRLSRSPREP